MLADAGNCPVAARGVLIVGVCGEGSSARALAIEPGIAVFGDVGFADVDALADASVGAI